MQNKAILAATAVAALVIAGQAWAEAPTLKFGSTTAPSFHIAKWFDAWAEEVSKVNPDVVKVKVYHNTLGNTNTILDSIRNRVADFGWFNPGYFAGQFDKFYVTQLPGLSPKAEYGSLAVWRMYSKNMFGDEFKSVHPLAMHTYPAGSLHTTYSVTGVASFKGHKFGMTNKVDGATISLLGAAPISVGLYAFYESLQNHVIDGIVSQWTAFAPFKLQEVTKYHIDVPLGSSAAVIAFNNDSWNALSEDAKKILTSKGGEYMSRGLGKFWDRVSDEAKDQAVKAPGHKLVTFSPAETDTFYKTIAPAFDEWRKNTPGSDALAKEYKTEYDAAAKGGTM